MAGGAGLGGYALGVEPFSERITQYAVKPPQWPAGMRLRIAALTDLHVCEPWLGLQRLERIVRETNMLQADVIVLLGDYVPGVNIERLGRAVPSSAWAAVLAGLRAPGGVHAILGNHDWWEDPVAQRTGQGPTEAHRALVQAGIRVHENTAVKLTKPGSTDAYWIGGLGDQWAFFKDERTHAIGNHKGDRFQGVDDLPGLLARVTDSAPLILLIHEPDIFPRVPARVQLTLAGHTHGGQVRLLGYSPVVPSRFANRYAYGHIVEDNRHLVVSAGLGVSGLPIRFGIPPEIVVVDVG
jgi:uncharacterized protein